MDSQTELYRSQLGVIGVIGIGSNKDVCGHVYSTGLNSVVGRPSVVPVPVHSIDEMVIIIRRESYLNFDAQLPGYHLYGTDICLQSLQRGLPCFAISNFCVHNSNGIRRLPWAFWQSYLYLRSKWSNRLPLSTLCVTIHSSLLRFAWLWLCQATNRRKPGRRIADPVNIEAPIFRESSTAAFVNAIPPI